MIDRDDTIEGDGAPGGDPPLPDDLVALHRELDSLRIEERASFGPELEAELEAAWEDERDGRGSGGRPSRSSALLAASVGGLLLLGLAAPQARAALAGIVGTVRQTLAELVEPSAVEEAPPPSMPVGAVDARPPDAGPDETARDEAPAEGPAPDRGAEPEAAPEVAVVFPDLWDREEASRLVQGFYPDDLSGTGIGGTVGLRMYVDSTGAVGEVRLIASSGIEALDAAAVRAAPSLRFRPARKGGVAVGAWVELGIDFSPGSASAPEAGGSFPPRER